ncbi:MAG: lasso peptide [Pleurocapsa sp. SU_5_0]|nr:lasso peptide [Pleurocapsa sp. SU_5_0]NJR45519.1 lasso peptide [Hyellaceae cyanobacterium CSU_1_1]
MKSQYSIPKLINYGNVETITQATGSTPTKDSIIFNGAALGVETDGSNDINLP